MKNKQAELIARLSNHELHKQLFLTQILLLVISAILGIILFDYYSSFMKLFRMEWKIIYIGVSAGLIVVLLDLVMMKRLPEAYHNDGGINERIFTSLSCPMIAVVALLVAISEELLFRGVLQTHIGLIWTSVLFALVHYRYLFHPFLFINIILLSFFIGFIFEMTGNLYVTISMHFTIDFILGLIIKLTKGKNLDRKREE
ncbi:CPBP family intramembrane glutamic endopeptidase [Peribacillus loiseleuriae]|uniref:Membrane protein n=1 Tax=Peribacillus loiseleuriae TaxID=1679170 RepID=A0A0K9GVG3_9BACI|nr:CPBP family intramembrane glutamic endopeptidase [Peribacillus loiseleuriae]KMY50630.1 membrane protein [Peribacillus loiseleuriae]